MPAVLRKVTGTQHRWLRAQRNEGPTRIDKHEARPHRTSESAKGVNANQPNTLRSASDAVGRCSLGLVSSLGHSTVPKSV
jgi:hypothetical protein